MKSNRCAVGSCDEPVKHSHLCHRHYNYIYFWTRRGIGKAIKHQQKLHQRQEALELLPGRANIITLKRRKTA